MRILNLLSVLMGLFFTVTTIKADVNVDMASNYSSSWKSGDNGGAGFGAWAITSTDGTGVVANGIWDSSLAGLEMGTAFGFGAWGDGAGIVLDRAFSQALGNGDVFAFDLAMNYAGGSGGNKGFVLRTSDNKPVITVNQSDSDNITINGATALTNSGTTTMHWTITQVSATQLNVYATGRSGSEAVTVTVTPTSASYIAGIQFYATNLVNDEYAASRGFYFDNMVLSQSAITSTFTYSVDSNLTTITSISTNATGAVIIPVTLGGYSVAAIGRSAFKDATNITSITFASGSGVTNIGPMAFQGCTKLTIAVLPTKLTSISAGLFSGCSNLISVSIPSGVTNMDAMAFENCSSLSSIALPTGLVTLGESAFLNCRNLRAVDFPDGVKSLSSQSCYECRKLSTVSLGSHLTTISKAAFYDCLSLSAIELPSTLTILGADGFNACSSLGSLSFMGKLTAVGDRAFYACSALESVYFHAGADSFGSGVFGYEPSLTEVYFVNTTPTLTDGGADLFENSAIPTIYSLNSSLWSGNFGGAVVQSWRPIMSAPKINSGILSFTVEWANGQTVQVQTCTNLTEGVWTSLTTGTISNGTCEFSDATLSSADQRFYRIINN
jgi:hypothetical protein